MTVSGSDALAMINHSTYRNLTQKTRDALLHYPWNPVDATRSAPDSALVRHPALFDSVIGNQSLFLQRAPFGRLNTHIPFESDLGPPITDPDTLPDPKDIPGMIDAIWQLEGHLSDAVKSRIETIPAPRYSISSITHKLCMIHSISMQHRLGRAPRNTILRRTRLHCLSRTGG